MKWTNGKIKTHQYVFSAHVLQGAQSYNRAYDRIDSNQTPIELREREGEKESVPYTRIYYIWYFHKKVTTERNNNTDNKKKQRNERQMSLWNPAMRNIQQLNDGEAQF